MALTKKQWERIAKAAAPNNPLQEPYDEGFTDGKEAAANWCARQASALYKLDREPEKRAAFVEAANAIRKIGTDQ